jgi:hypothetical protein
MRMIRLHSAQTIVALVFLFWLIRTTEIIKILVDDRDFEVTANDDRGQIYRTDHGRYSRLVVEFSEVMTILAAN